MENKKLPFHQGKIIWLKPFYQMGIETHQGIQIPYTNGIPGQTIKCRLKKTAKNHYDIIKVKFKAGPYWPRLFYSIDLNLSEI